MQLTCHSLGKCGRSQHESLCLSTYSSQPRFRVVLGNTAFTAPVEVREQRHHRHKVTCVVCRLTVSSSKKVVGLNIGAPLLANVAMSLAWSEPQVLLLTWLL